jgi:hypothetical protein
MPAYVVDVSAQPGKLKEAVKHYRRTIVPALRKHKLYRDAILLVDPDRNRIRCVTLFDKACPSASEARAFFRARMARSGDLISGRPSLRKFALESELGAEPPRSKA